jgi:hypothetical protein
MGGVLRVYGQVVLYGLGSVKFGIGCKHFRVSCAIFSGRYGNLCCSISMFGSSVVMNEYNSFCMLSSGLVMCWFSKWNFCSLCKSVDRGFGLSIKFLIRFIIH